MVNFCFLPPEEVTPIGANIYEAAREEILKKWDTYSPGLQAQYKIHFDRLDRGAPNSEFILLKGPFPGPSTYAPEDPWDFLFTCEFRPASSWEEAH